MSEAVDFHSEIAEKFKERYKTNPNFKERFSIWSSLIDKYISAKDIVLDAGCGSGILSFYAAAKGNQVLGIDGSSSMIELCKKQLANTSIDNLTFQQHYLPVRGEALPIQRANCIVSSSVLEYVEEYEATLKSLSDFLETEGVLIISIPNQLSFYRKIEKYLFKAVGRPSYYKFMKNLSTQEKLKETLGKNGLVHLETVYYSSHYPFSGLMKFLFPQTKTHNLFVSVFKKK